MARLIRRSPEEKLEKKSGVELDKPNTFKRLIRMSVKQLPEYGVRTKNNKAAITFLYQIPKLLTIIQTWDVLVRTELDINSPWYAYLSSDGMNFAGTIEASAYRRQDFARGLKKMCK